MAYGQWEHTASLLCIIHNLLAEWPKSPDDFNPLAVHDMGLVVDKRKRRS